jgi:CRISPR-associated protein Csh2
MPKEYIDVRAFGAAVTLSNANFSLTGTVQFGLGRSLNIPTIQTKTITATLASTEQKGQGTFGEYHTVDYTIINFHGIVSEINAKDTGFNQEDLDNVFNGLWSGTKQLNTRSKFNHMPRLLIDVESIEGKSQIGDLDLCFELTEKEGIKTIEEVELNISNFVKRVKEFQENLKSLNYYYDETLKLIDNNNIIENLKQYLEKELPDIAINELKIKGE